MTTIVSPSSMAVKVYTAVSPIFILRVAGPSRLGGKLSRKDYNSILDLCLICHT